jgi:D-amino-acid dehydrogenase
MARSILIVGGGVIGLSMAYYALRKGHRVTLLERGGPGHDCCSQGNAGMVVPSHFIPLAAPGMVGFGLRMMWNPESPFYIKPRLSPELLSWGWKFWRASTKERVERAAPFLRDLSLASRQSFEDLAANHEFGLVKKGLLMLCKSGHVLQDEAATAERANQLGIPADVLTPQQTAKLDPALRMDIAGSIFFPKDCHLTPHLFTAALTHEIQKQGGQFKWETEVRSWKRNARGIEAVQTSAGEFQADEYVVAGGAWSSRVLQGLGLKLPMQAGKGYSLTLNKPRRLPVLCSILTEARVAVTPMGSALRFGGTMEMAGLDESINPIRVQGITKAIPKYFPEFESHDFEGITAWRGFRPCSPDGLPYMGRINGYNNLSVATGHAMMGLSLGPITGKLMAQILSGEAPSIGLELVDPNRYS